MLPSQPPCDFLLTDGRSLTEQSIKSGSPSIHSYLDCLNIASLLDQLIRAPFETVLEYLIVHWVEIVTEQVSE